MNVDALVIVFDTSQQWALCDAADDVLLTVLTEIRNLSSDLK